MGKPQVSGFSARLVSVDGQLATPAHLVKAAEIMGDECSDLENRNAPTGMNITNIGKIARHHQEMGVGVKQAGKVSESGELEKTRFSGKMRS